MQEVVKTQKSVAHAPVERHKIQAVQRHTLVSGHFSSLTRCHRVDSPSVGGVVIHADSSEPLKEQRLLQPPLFAPSTLDVRGQLGGAERRCEEEVSGSR